MKQIFTLIACIFSFSLFTNAQFSENFDGPLSGWTLKNSIIDISKALKIEGKKGSFITPTIQPSSTSKLLSFSMSYRFSAIDGNAKRTLTIIASKGGATTVDLTPTLTYQTVTFNLNTITTDPQTFEFNVTDQSNNSFDTYIDNLVISGSAPSPIILPIKLVNFDAKYKAPSVTLNWSTAQEKNFSHFEIETSTDGSIFAQAGIVFGSGDADTKRDYVFEEKNIKMNGLVYYRLKSVDNDGKFSYSAVRIIRTGEAAKTLSLSTYPNPAVSELRLTIPSNWQGKPVKMELYNGNGQKVMERTNTNASQTEVMNVNNLNKGMYVVKAICGTENAMEKVLKN